MGQALVYHLSDLKGMSRWPDKFGAVGLSETSTQDAVHVAGSFMLKARELQRSVAYLISYTLHAVECAARIVSDSGPSLHCLYREPFSHSRF